MLLILAGSASADNTTLDFIDDPVLVHDCIDTITAEVTTDQAIKAFDVVAEILSVSGGAFAEVLDVTIYVDCGSDTGWDDTKIRDGDSDTLRFWGTDLATACDVISPGTRVLAEIEVQVGYNLGTFDIVPSSWMILEDPVIAVTNFVDGAAASSNLTFNNGHYTVINTPPYFTNCPTANLVHQCSEGQICYDFDADDDDCATTLTYSLGTGTGGVINPTTGLWCINVSHMCGLYPYQVIVTDEHGAQAVCDFFLYVWTEPPYFTDCPTDSSVTRILWGGLAHGQVIAVDPDQCPEELTYTLDGITGPGMFPGTFNLNSTTGEWSWQTLEEPEYIGWWEVCIVVDDGCEVDTCCFWITVVPTYRVYIEKVHDVYQGHYQWVNVFLSDTTDYLGGYDFLIAYDASALTFMEAELGADLVACHWEYFTYRFGPFGNCEGPCPSGFLRIVAMAETNNGPYHPDENCAAGPLVLARLKFYVTNDRTFGCMYIPVQFYWFDCGDNGISSVTGDTLWISRYVFNYDCFGGYYEITGTPGYGGWQGTPYDCTEPLPNKPPALVGIDFYNGGIDIICPDSIDATGDLNLNDIANEIADAVLYTNYFIYGLMVFNINPEGQIAASDVNNDGRVLTVGDLVYLTRLITGDEYAYPKLTPFASSGQVGIETAGSMVRVSSSAPVDVGAAHFVFSVDGTVEKVTSLISGMDLKSDVVDGELRVLVYNIGEGRIPAGENDLFSVEVNGALTVVESSMADYYGNDMNVTTATRILPTDFALLQNYPNPFNPSTDIVIELPGPSEWKLDIYNVTGQLVESFNGYSTGGSVKVTWDAGDAASGIYLYKATAGQLTDVKKMVLMK
jgi:hypothetical protein